MYGNDLSVKPTKYYYAGLTVKKSRIWSAKIEDGLEFDSQDDAEDCIETFPEEIKKELVLESVSV